MESDVNLATAPLRLPGFRNFIALRFFVPLAQQIQAVAVAWQVYSLTKDPLSLGLIGLAEVIPAVSFALIAGHLIDRYDRRKIMLWSLVLTTFVGIFLWVLSAGFFDLSLSPRSHVNLIYFAIFLSGVARAFLSSSTFVLFANIVPKSATAQATAWSSSVWQVAAAGGPAVGGLLYGFYGATSSYAAATVAFLIGMLAIVFLRLKKSVKSTSASPAAKEPFVHSLTQGLHFVFRHPLILSALSLDLFAVLFGGAVALLPIFADLLHVGPEGLGLLRAAPSVGAFIMAFFLAHRPPSRQAGRVLLGAVAIFGLCMIGFGLSRSFLLSFALLALSGAVDNISVVVRTTLLQWLTPGHMRGRVSAVNLIFISSSNEIGAFESGLTAKWMGAVPSVLFGGVMTLIVVGVVGTLSPKIRKLDFEALQAEVQPGS